MSLKIINQEEPINSLQPDPKPDDDKNGTIKEIQENTDEIFETIIAMKN